MFGVYQKDFSIKSNGLEVSAFKQADKWCYTRSLDTEHITTKIILNDSLDLVIQPIAPILQPKPITPYLMIALRQDIIISPIGHRVIYLIMPIEIGCFLLNKQKIKEMHLLDNLRLSASKYTLYGTPSDGKICQYCASDIYSEIPETKYLHQGVLKVKIKNHFGGLVKLSKVVLDARKLFFYQQGEMVGCTIALNVEQQIAKTECLKEPLCDGMSEAPNYNLTNRWSEPNSRRFVMDYGI